MPRVNWANVLAKRTAVLTLILSIAIFSLTSSCETALNPTSSPAPTDTIAPTPTAPALTPFPTSIPAPSPAPTSTPTPPPTPTPTPGSRDISEWTAENPATFEEIEAALEKYRGESLTIASWGGAYEEAQHQGYFLPFQQKFGITIETTSGALTWGWRERKGWQVVDVLTENVHGMGEGHTDSGLNPAIHNGYLSGFPEIARTPWTGGGGVAWSTGLAYNLDSVDEFWDVECPNSWADFWDTERFPGKRGMRDRSTENIFFALLALNPDILVTNKSRRAISKLTPEEVDASFIKLEEIAPHINEWWAAGTDCPKLLLSRELHICTTWNNRIWDAQQEEEGESLHYCYECGHLIQTGAFSIMWEFDLGPDQTQLAELFIAWTGYPHINARISEYTAFGPLNQHALPILKQSLPPERFSSLPNSLLALPNSLLALQTTVMLDEAWLYANRDFLEERWERFTRD